LLPHKSCHIQKIINGLFKKQGIVYIQLFFTVNGILKSRTRLLFDIFQPDFIDKEVLPLAAPLNQNP
jgi:hypothetical protein